MQATWLREESFEASDEVLYTARPDTSPEYVEDFWMPGGK